MKKQHSLEDVVSKLAESVKSLEQHYKKSITFRCIFIGVLIACTTITVLSVIFTVLMLS